MMVFGHRRRLRFGARMPSGTFDILSPDRKGALNRGATTSAGRGNHIS